MERLSCFHIVIFDESQWLWIASACLNTREDDRLVVKNACRFVRFLRIASPILEIGLGAGHKEGPNGMECVEAFEVDIASVDHVKGARFQGEYIEDIDVLQFAVGDMDEGGNAAA